MPFFKIVLGSYADTGSKPAKKPPKKTPAGDPLKNPKDISKIQV